MNPPAGNAQFRILHNGERYTIQRQPHYHADWEWLTCWPSLHGSEDWQSSQHKPFSGWVTRFRWVARWKVRRLTAKARCAEKRNHLNTVWEEVS